MSRDITESTSESGFLYRILTGRILWIGASLIGIISLAVVFTYPYWRGLWPVQVQGSDVSRTSVAVVEAVEADVRVRTKKDAEWQKGKVGLQLFEGDLLQTDKSSRATVKYVNGTSVSVPPDTVFWVRGVDQRTEKPQVSPNLTAGAVDVVKKRPPADPTQVVADPPKPISRETEKQARSETPKIAPRPAPEPSLLVHKIISFGRSLEIIGKVDPGNRLFINGEAAIVEPDGSFKHFTKPFPRPGRVELFLKTNDLAGRVRTLTRTAIVQ